MGILQFQIKFFDLTKNIPISFRKLDLAIEKWQNIKKYIKLPKHSN